MNCHAQSGLRAILDTAPSKGENQIAVGEKLARFLEPLRALDHGNQSSLKTIFRKTQRSFLHTYRAYSGMNELFTKGQYDCLTATALFSLILDELGYSYDIMETNYHVFLLVHTSRGELLIESTDRFGGLVKDPAAIASRIQLYRNQLPTGSVGQEQNYYAYSFNIYRSITRSELIGLMYYNQAVVAFNNGAWQASRDFVSLARLRYASPRCRELDALLNERISASVEHTESYHMQNAAMDNDRR